MDCEYCGNPLPADHYSDPFCSRRCKFKHANQVMEYEEILVESMRKGITDLTLERIKQEKRRVEDGDL